MGNVNYSALEGASAPSPTPSTTPGGQLFCMSVYLFRSFHESSSSSKWIEPSSSSLLLRNSAGSPCSVNSTSHFTSSPSQPAHAEPQPNPPSCNQFPAPHSMAAAWLNEEEEWCSEAVQRVILRSKKSSTRMICLAKWKRFSILCSVH